MENHPIPQDVTGFKFRLIGSITVKQFLYIIGAGALCGAFFIMPISMFIKWPAIILIAGIGAALAFLPIEGRPMDVMLLNFLKALPAENKYIFRKEGARALIQNYFVPQKQKTNQNQQTKTSQQQSKREMLLDQLVRKNPSYKPDDDEKEQLDNIKGFFDDSNTPVTGMKRVDEAPQENQQNTPSSKTSTIVRPPQQNTPSNQPVRADGYDDEQEHTQTQNQSQSASTQQKPKTGAQPVNTSSYVREIPDDTPKTEKTPKEAAPTEEASKKEEEAGSSQNQKKEQQTAKTKQPVQGIPHQEAPETNKAQQKPQQTAAPAKTVPPQDQVASGFPQIPDTPNVVLGIVKDARGKVLPNIIVEVVDENKNPVRAFKTNALGQFSSATPLPKGKYQVILEDPRGNHEFSPIDIEMKDEIFQPLEIISTDQREKLRQELFGGTNSAQQ